MPKTGLTRAKPNIFGVPSLETARSIDDADKVAGFHAAHFRLCSRKRELEITFEQKAAELRARSWRRSRKSAAPQRMMTRNPVLVALAAVSLAPGRRRMGASAPMGDERHVARWLADRRFVVPMTGGKKFVGISLLDRLDRHVGGLDRSRSEVINDIIREHLNRVGSKIKIIRDPAP